MGEVIVVTSGKGGVGKTTTTANVGTGLAAAGRKVVLIDTDIGLLPVPKYDAGSEYRHTFTTYWSSIMAVSPISPEQEMTGVLLEAMNAENYKSVIPEYLDTALKGKYSRDEKTAEMIDLVNESAYFDFAFVNASTGTATWIGYQLLHGSENIVSTYEKSRVSLDQKLESLLDIYRGQAES